MARCRFADLDLDLDRFDVTRAGRRLTLEPKALLVLQFLVERPGRLVTKDELLDGVWPGVAVTPNALPRVVAQLRREFGDNAADARFIETVPTRGYRFIAEIETLPAGDAVVAAVAAAAPARGGILPWRWAAVAAAGVAAMRAMVLDSGAQMPVVFETAGSGASVTLTTAGGARSARCRSAAR